MHASFLCSLQGVVLYVQEIEKTKLVIRRIAPVKYYQSSRQPEA
jgi:hypothetical protein